MSGYWELAGRQLTATNVQVKATAATHGQRVRQALEDIHGGTQYRERVGVDLATKSITFIAVGRGDPKWDEAAYIIGIVTGSDGWLLKAPDNYYVVPKLQAGMFSTTQVQQTEEANSSLGKLQIQVDAIYDGTLPVDGGSYVLVEAWREDFL